MDFVSSILDGVLAGETMFGPLVRATGVGAARLMGSDAEMDDHGAAILGAAVWVGVVCLVVGGIRLFMPTPEATEAVDVSVNVFEVVSVDE